MFWYDHLDGKEQVEREGERDKGEGGNERSKFFDELGGQGMDSTNRIIRSGQEEGQKPDGPRLEP